MTPLGFGNDASGNQLGVVRVDYLSLWNADGGSVGGGAPCSYSYFGLDQVINQISGHDLDAERSVMLLAAPVQYGSYNLNAANYKLYSVYTAAHEGTFFDESEYLDFSTLVAYNNQILLGQSLSKHSTYDFNPDYYPITPGWFIAAGLEVARLLGRTGGRQRQMTEAKEKRKKAAGERSSGTRCCQQSRRFRPYFYR